MISLKQILQISDWDGITFLANMDFFFCICVFHGTTLVLSSASAKMALIIFVVKNKQFVVREVLTLVFDSYVFSRLIMKYRGLLGLLPPVVSSKM